MTKPRLHYWLILALAMLCMILSGRAVPSLSAISLTTAPDEPWTAPSAAAVKDVGSVSPNAITRSYSCTDVTYRFAEDIHKTMRSGCFVSTTFGLYDPSKSVVIFKGSDEAMPLRYHGSTPGLLPLPSSNEMAQFGGFTGVGNYMHLFTALPDDLQKTSDGLADYENLTKAPDITVTAPSGRPLVVNSSAMAFAARGQWMVTESPSHSLVRVNMTTFDVLPFDISFYNIGSPYKTHTASLAITEDGRYAAVASSEYSTLKVYDLKSCTTVSPTDSLAPQNCRSHDFWPYLRDIVSGDFRVSRANFVSDGLLSLDIHTDSGTETYLLSPSGTPATLLPYLGLGDSYASGQGTFNYVTGTDTDINHCHLAERSYPLLLSGDVFSGQGHSVACSGARIHDIGNISPDYIGQVNDQRRADSREADGSTAAILQQFTPGYVAQQQFVAKYLPGVITVQIGGNDIGFADILLRCMSPLAIGKPGLNANSCYQSYEDRLEVMQTIDRTYGKWVALYQQLQQASPASQIYAIGYPQILSAKADCGLNVHLTGAEITFARGLTDYLNKIIQQAATTAGVHYIDISDALSGHELCSGSGGEPAMNGLTAGKDALGVLGQESFHPNAYGHELIEQAILQATHNFAAIAKPMAASDIIPPAPSSSEPLLQVPKSGRPTTTVVPATIVDGAATVGGTLHLSLGGSEAGLRPNTTYNVQLGGTKVGSINSSEQGDIHTDITLPDTVAPGLQPLTITGTNLAGDKQTTQQTVYVDSNTTDYDGDGIKNSSDSCPYAANLGIDTDRDGVDDTCDQLMSLSSAAGDSDQTISATAAQRSSQPTVQNTVSPGLVPITTNTELTAASAPQAAVTSQGYLKTTRQDINQKSLLHRQSYPTAAVLGASIRQLHGGQFSRPLFYRVCRSLPLVPVLMGMWWYRHKKIRRHHYHHAR